ncbi:hypothetical protein KKE38_03880 [Candidatus Micrarchaeota archaeon]|nr:hypothetical protein [Candidatus Micrarchaeota archaeon]
MRQKTRSSVQSVRSSTKEPLAEGLQIAVPTDSRGRRMWRRLSDDQIIEFAKKLMDEGNLTGRKELIKSDRGLYRVLRKRGLLDEIGFAQKKRKPRSWKDRTDEEVVEFARKVLKENEITRMSELNQIDSGLYVVLRERGLFDRVGVEGRRRSWKIMSDEKIVELAKKVMEDEGLTERGELRKIDLGLYYILRRRKLLDKIDFDNKIREKRSWKLMSDEEIVELARKVMRNNMITMRIGLQAADCGLYNVLRKRGLLDELDFQEEVKKRRSWAGMSNTEIAGLAKKLMKENCIIGRKELEEADRGLYRILWKRGLLDHVFAHVDRQKADLARDAVIDALDAFVANDNAVSEDDVA